MRRLLIAALAVPLLGEAPTASVDIVVNDVRNARGHVRAEICTQQTFLHPDCPWSGSASAHPGSVTVHIAGVPPGTYAAQLYHDENDNHRVDRNLIGIPTEGVGFSRDAPFRFGPPSWDDAAFTVGPDGARITVTLRHFNP